MPSGGTGCKVEKVELYDLVNDMSETTDVAEKHPDIVQRLESEAEKARVELGDSLKKRTGKGVREPGRVEQEKKPGTEKQTAANPS
jgi:hypothetical protein